MAEIEELKKRIEKRKQALADLLKEQFEDLEILRTLEKNKDETIKVQAI